MRYFETGILAVSALALLYACFSRLIIPTEAVFLRTLLSVPDVTLADHPSLASEVRGVGAVMLIGAIIGLVGILKVTFRGTSFIVLSTIFVGIAVGRSTSILIDGLPEAELLLVLAIEILIAAALVLCSIGFWRRTNQVGGLDGRNA